MIVLNWPLHPFPTDYFCALLDESCDENESVTPDTFNQ